MKISEFATVVTGGTPSTKNNAFWEQGTIPWLQSGVCKNSYVDICSKKITQAGLENSSAKMMPAGTVIIALTGATVGKVGLLRIDACANQSVSGIIPNELFLPKYLFYYLLSIRWKIIHDSYGDAQPHISQQYVKDIEVPLPSLEEQKQIVARIEELFSQLDAGMETLKKSKAQLEAYRQAVLKEVFESVVDESQTVNVEDVCKDIKVGIVIKPAQYYTTEEKGVRAFRSANVREFSVNNSDWVYLTKDGHSANARSELHTGDVLVVRSGYPGIACVVPPEYDGCNAIDILIAVPDADKIIPEYLCAYTNSPLGRKIVQEKKRGVAQAHFNVGGYSKTPIILPSLNTQRRVVEIIESRISVCDSIDQTITVALQQAEAMRQSVLKEAFEGRL